MIVEHMFHLTKTQVMTFVNSALIIGTEAPREGFFKANLVFTKQGKLLTLCLLIFHVYCSLLSFLKVNFLKKILQGIPS